MRLRPPARFTNPQGLAWQAIGGERDSLLAILCERYQLPRQTADWQVSAWQNAYTDRWLYGSPCELH